MTDYQLELSTRVAPPKKFLVDGVEYELLGIDNLSADDEAECMARFSRYGQTSNALSIAEDLVQGKRLATSLRKQRTALLTKLTSLPKDVADRLPGPEAVKLITAAQQMMEEDPDADEKDDAADDE